MEKKIIRQQIREKKRQISVQKQQQYSMAIQARIFESKAFLEADVIYTYVSYNQEVDTLGVIDRAFLLGKRVAVPKVVGKEIEFYYIQKLSDLVIGYQGILEPCTNEIATDDSIYMIVPGLCFDRNGGRIGYGGGFYDRYFSSHNAATYYKVALGYGFQLLDHVELEEHDQRVDVIVTPDEYIVV